MAAHERHVLVVCTANVCRSPVAERLLQRDWAADGFDVRVRSAGTFGGRNEVHPHTVTAGQMVGIDLTGHRSRQLTAEMIAVDGADLVIGMTREHLRASIGLDPPSWPRSFTLRELVRRTRALPEPPADWDTWLATCHQGRNHHDLLRPDPADDLPDAYGHPLGHHVQMAQEVAASAAIIAAALLGT